MTEWKMARSGTARGNWVGSILILLRITLVFKERPGEHRAQIVPDTLRVDVGLGRKRNPGRGGIFARCYSPNTRRKIVSTCLR